MTALIRGFSFVNVVITRLGVMISGVLIAVMTAAVLLQVISREMRAPIGWTEELALASMVWLSFLVGPWAYRQHSFTRIDIFRDMLGLRSQRVLDLLIHIFECIVIVGALYYSWSFFLKGTSLLPALTTLMRDIAAPFIGTAEAQDLTLRNYSIYIVLPIGFLGLLMVNIEHMLRAILTIATQQDHPVSPEIEPEGHGGAEGIVLPEFDDNDPRSGGHSS